MGSSLSRDEVEKVLAASVRPCEKRAASLADVTSSLKAIADPLVSVVKGYAGSIPAVASASAIIGGSLGGLYNVAKNGISGSGDDKEISTKARLYATYKTRKRELEDIKWMKKVIGKRSELKKNMKKMTPDEYRAAYADLSDAIDERRS